MTPLTHADVAERLVASLSRQPNDPAAQFKLKAARAILQRAKEDELNDSEIINDLVKAVENMLNNSEGHVSRAQLVHELARADLWIARRPKSAYPPYQTPRGLGGENGKWIGKTLD